jgi:ABC-type nitrate/sulfonate/bicarbonate transport system substrate-binding protein
LIDLDIPFIYSSIHAASRSVKERPEMVQRMVAAFAEAINFVDNNPVKAKAAIGKVMRVKDEEALQISYNVYTKDIVDRRMIVPAGAVAESVELLRASGTQVKRKPEEIYDNSFVQHLEKSGYLKDLWGK